jgi:hypothetical protein
MKFRINFERIGFISLRNGYHALWLRYSNEMTWDNKGKKRILWCFPKFEYRELRGK